MPGARPPVRPGTDPYRSLELSNAGSSMLRWALGIRPGSRWLESKVDPLEKTGFRLQTWNRLPQAKPTVKVAAKEVGLKADGAALQVQWSGPAFRQPAELEVTWTEDWVLVKVSKPARVRLAYRVLRPEWPGRDKPALRRRLAGDRTEVVDRDVTWEDHAVEWQAAPGEYELRKGQR